MVLGILATSWIGAWTVRPWGTCGIAAANAAGISLTAALLLAGTRRRGVVPIRVRQVLAELSRPVAAALAATLAGAFAASRFAAAVPALAAGLLTVTAVFALLGLALGAQGVAPAFRSVRSVTRRLAHGRFR
jgi:putative peptidoglycan lipid II flippase